MTPAPKLEPTPAGVAVMSCHRVKRDAQRLRQQLAEVLQRMQVHRHPDAMREYRPAFQAMYLQVTALRRSLETVQGGADASSPMLEEDRALDDALELLLNDTDVLADLLLRLIDVNAPEGDAPVGP